MKYLDINPLDPKALTLKSPATTACAAWRARENYAQGDATFDIDNSVITAVKFGAKLRDNTLQQHPHRRARAGPGSAGLAVVLAV